MQKVAWFIIPAVLPSIVKLVSLFLNAVWLDEVFLPVHQQRLRDAANKTRDTLVSLGIQVRPAQAGFFLWADFRCFLPVVSRDEELGKSSVSSFLQSLQATVWQRCFVYCQIWHCCINAACHCSVWGFTALSCGLFCYHFVRCQGSIMQNITSAEACRWRFVSVEVYTVRCCMWHFGGLLVCSGNMFVDNEDSWPMIVGYFCWQCSCWTTQT